MVCMEAMALVDEVDPGSLVALESLLRERSVTRAARRLGITQSSMSHRLALLRERLADPLLVRRGAVLVLTPRAEAILPPLSAALTALREAVQAKRPFDPAAHPRTVSIAMPDLLAPLVPRLLRALEEDDARCMLRVRTPPPSLADALATGDPELALCPVGDVVGSSVVRRLGQVEFGVVGREGHPALRRPLTVASWTRHPHVLLRTGNESPNAVGGHLEKAGVRREIGLEVPSFLAGLIAVAGSDLLMNVPIVLVRDLLGPLGLRARPAPISLPIVPVALAWHARFQADEGHRWARERIYGVVRRELSLSRHPVRTAKSADGGRSAR